MEFEKHDGAAMLNAWKPATWNFSSVSSSYSQVLRERRLPMTGPELPSPDGLSRIIGSLSPVTSAARTAAFRTQKETQIFHREGTQRAAKSFFILFKES